MDLFEGISSDTTILTPNRRLSAALIKKHHYLQIKKGHSCWQSPSILPFASWLERLWTLFSNQEMTDTFLLLNNNQEQILWENILRESPESDSLLQLSKTAELVKSAWGIIKKWQIDINHPDFQATEDTAIFQKWAKQYDECCIQNSWLDQYSVTDYIIEKIAENKITPPPHILLTGFTELSPQQNHLLMCCQTHGSKITHYAKPTEQSITYRTSLPDSETEIRTMARWAKSILENTSSSDIKIGCVIQNLEDRRDEVIRIFSEIFDTENTYTLNYTLLPFNISAGKTLAAYPIIHTAFQILHLYSGKLPLHTLSSMLRSPFLGEAENERLQRAYFDSRLHSANTLSISLKTLLTHSNDSLYLPSFCPALSKRLTQYSEKISTLKKLLPISEWVPLFIELLQIAGWPGERPLNSTEYQTVQNCWLPLLTQYATFDTILPPQNFKNALHYLTRLAANTVFQPQSPEAPIQILGILEAVELPFDYLWVMGLDDTTWPSPAKPNPFIPPYLQKLLHTPNANAERELIYCKTLTEQLKQTAKLIIFSHALQNEKSELRPSALIKKIPEIKLTENALTEERILLSNFISPAQRVFRTQSLERICDEYAPPVAIQDGIRGGR